VRLRTGAMLAVLLALLASPGFAQGTTTFGAKGGLNLADLSLDPAEGCCDIKEGLAFGGFVDIGLRNMFSFQPEILFTQKGAETSDTAVGESVSLKLDYIEFPLLVKANFQTTGNVRPFAVFGPGIGFRTAAHIDDDDIEDETGSTDFSLIFGGGVTIGHAIVEARYDIGLSDIATDEDGSAKTRTFSILVGYSFLSR
jgi:Outer membrane protein beta-barrel domain